MKKIILLLMIVFSFINLNSKDIEITASVNSLKIGIDDLLVYTITFKGINNPQSPDISYINDFNIVSQSRSSEFRFTNGISSYLTNFVFYLRPKKTGVLKIPAFKFKYNGKEYKTIDFKIEVVKGSLSPPQRRRSNPFDDDFFNDDAFGMRRQEFKVNLFLRAVVSKNSVYRGEQLIYKVLLYTQNNVRSVNLISSSSFKGFWQEWYPTPKTISGKRVNYKGSIYNVFEIKKAALFPNQAGIITIPPLKFEINITDTSFFSLGGIKNIQRATQKIKINVKDLPNNKEVVGIGDFSLSLNPYKKTININDIFTYSYVIKGNGNIKDLNIPRMESNDFYDVFEPKITRNLEYKESEVLGKVKVEYPISFKKSGAISISSPLFRFFNPEKKSFEIKSFNPVVVRVEGSKKTSSQVEIKKGVKIEKKAEDIKFIRLGNLKDNNNHIGKSLIYWIFFVLPFLINLFLFIKLFIFNKYVLNSRFFLKFSLLNSIVKEIENAKNYADLYPVIERYLKKSIGIEYSKLTDIKIEEFLYSLKLNQSMIKDFLRIKNIAESSRFSPIKVNETEFNKDKNRLIDLIKRIHKEL